MSRRLVGLLLGAALLAGCGHDAPAGGAATAALSDDVARLKAAATSGTSADVARAADALRTDVGTQQQSGDLSAARAAAILDQLARVLADTAARPSPTPSATPTRTAAPRPVRSEPHRKGKGKGGD